MGIAVYTREQGVSERSELVPCNNYDHILDVTSYRCTNCITVAILSGLGNLRWSPIVIKRFKTTYIYKETLFLRYDGNSRPIKVICYSL